MYTKLGWGKNSARFTFLSSKEDILVFDGEWIRPVPCDGRFRFDVEFHYIEEHPDAEVILRRRETMDNGTAHISTIGRIHFMEGDYTVDLDDPADRSLFVNETIPVLK